MQRIVFLNNDVGRGGAEKQMLLIARGLRGFGYECVQYWLNGANPVTRKSPILHQAHVAGVQLEPPVSGRRFDFGQVWKLRQYLARNPDAMVWTWGHRADLVALALRATGCRNTIIGSLRSAFESRVRKYRHFWRLLGRTHDAFVSNSELNVRQVEVIARRVGKKSVVIYNAVEEPYFSAASLLSHERPTHLTIKMLGNQTSHIKGYDLALEIGSQFKARDMDVQIVIGGEPDDADVLQRLIDHHGLQRYIQLVGSVDDTVEFLRSGHVFLMLSRYEGTPNALIEAMALGIPAIATPVGDAAALAQAGLPLRVIERTCENALHVLVELWNDWGRAREKALLGRERCHAKFGEQVMLAATDQMLKALSARRASTCRVCSGDA